MYTVGPAGMHTWTHTHTHTLLHIDHLTCGSWTQANHIVTQEIRAKNTSVGSKCTHVLITHIQKQLTFKTFQFLAPNLLSIVSHYHPQSPRKLPQKLSTGRSNVSAPQISRKLSAFELSNQTKVFTMPPANAATKQGDWTESRDVS